MNVILTLNLVVLTAIFVVLLVFSLNFRRKVRQIEAIYTEFRSFIAEPVEPGKPTGLAVLVDMMATTFARSMLQQLKASEMGMKSGLKRGEQAGMGDMVQGMLAAKYPWLGLLLQVFAPKFGKTLVKSQGALDLAGALQGKTNESGNHEQDAYK